jgi:peptidase C10-like protein/Spi protease inhibitor/type IX secretion system substrate protein
MKKLTYVLSIFVLAINIANAAPVKPIAAQKVAENFYKQNSKTELLSSTLVYTEVSAGLPVYYVFDINSNDGFVIVAAEDVSHPIIGYSTVNRFVVPNPTENTNFNYWLKACKTGINTMRIKASLPSADIAIEWQMYEKNKPGLITASRLTGHASIASTGSPVVGPLCQTIWNQSPIYNAMCPGTGTNQAVTGCVATAMAQIMRYWSYPTMGTGSSSYCDCTADGYSDNNGTLSANYGATTYSWSAMPFNITTPNTAVATLMYQCGVSVDMDYDPSGSGADVIGVGFPCAQNSYITYFKYNPSTIQGLRRSSYTESAWLTLIENDLNLGRLVQYVGTDPSEGGHTWVCDGYDSNNYLHMNWGWGGSSDGWFQVDSLTTPGFDPSSDHQAVLGIVPMTSTTLDAGIPVINAPVGFYCTDSLSPVIKLQNYGSTTLTFCTINYQIDGNTVQTQSWTGSLVSFQGTFINLPSFTLGAGTHTLTCYSSSPNSGTDQNASNDQYSVIFNITNSGILPIIEGFETATCVSGTLPNSNWNVSHTSTTGGVDFQITTSAAATGSNSCMLNNFSNVGGNNSILQTALNYDMTTFTTPALSFKAAYQQKATTNTDMLQIAISTDCGATWVSKRVISSATLASLAGGTGTSAYVPNSSQFTTYTVNINTVAGNHNVMFRWVFLSDPSGPGNNLYIDDINIVDIGASPQAAIQSVETTVDLNVYPNPSAGKVNIDFNLSEKHNIAVAVTDMLGRTVETIAAKPYQSGETMLTIGADNAYQAGIYLVNINIDGQRISKKVVIQ